MGYSVHCYSDTVCSLSNDQVSLSQTRVVKQKMLKAPQSALYYKDIIVILNSLHPLCFCEEVIVERWCGNNFLCRGGTFVVLNYRKKKLVLGVLAEPSGSGSHVLLLTFFIWLKGKTVFDLRCGRQAGSWDLGQNSGKQSSSGGAGKAEGWWRSTHIHLHTKPHGHVCTSSWMQKNIWMITLLRYMHRDTHTNASVYQTTPLSNYKQIPTLTLNQSCAM